MNIRSLTRGDGVVIGAALLLFIASFLNTFKCDGSSCGDVPNAWSNGALFLGMYLAGIIGAALIILSRALPQQSRRIAGLEMHQFGAAFTVFAAWTSLGAIFDPAGPVDPSLSLSAGSGLILGLIAAVVLAAAALGTPFVPLLKAGLISAPRPAAPQPYGAQAAGAGGYGYPGGQQGFGTPDQPQAFGTPGRPQGFGTPPDAAQAPQQSPSAPAAGDFAPFWFAVPVARRLFAEDGSPTPIAELAPGNWYLAVEQRGSALVAQTQDGRRGVLQDTSNIQRG